MTDRMEHYKRGLALFSEQKHEEAVEEYRKALELSPDWTECMHALAMAISNLGRQEEAIANRECHSCETCSCSTSASSQPWDEHSPAFPARSDDPT